MNTLATGYPHNDFTINGTFDQSYTDFANAFEENIKTFLDLVQNKFPYHGNNVYTDGKCSAQALYWSSDTSKAPKAASLEGIFSLSSQERLNDPSDVDLYYDEKISPQKGSLYSKIESAIQPIMNSWHPNQKTEIAQINIQTSYPDERFFDHYDLVKNIDLKTDSAPTNGESYYYALATLSPKDNPLIRGEQWILRDGQEVSLEGIYNYNDVSSNSPLKLVVRTLNTDETIVISKEDLERPMCYTSQTRPIVPGLFLNPEKAASLRDKKINFINGCRFNLKQMRDKLEHGQEDHISGSIRKQIEEFAKDNVVFLPLNETMFYNPRFQVYGKANPTKDLVDNPACNYALFSRMLVIVYKVLGK